MMKWVIIIWYYNSGMVSVPMDSKEACLNALKHEPADYSICLNTNTGVVIEDWEQSK